MSRKSDTRKNVVVVGGGYAGVHVVNSLAKVLDRARYNLILVTPRPYYVHLLATLRMVVSSADKLEDNALIPYDRLAGGLEHVVGRVAAFEDAPSGLGKVLVLSNGERIEYAAVILATGSLWSGVAAFGDTDEAIRDRLLQWRVRFAEAKNIVIIGGGAVGIELAGEVKEVYPKKHVTIVHSERMLLNDTYPESFRNNIEIRTRAAGIDIVASDYVDQIPEPGATVDLQTRNGKTVPEVGLVVPAFGAKPNTAFMKTLGGDLLSERGYVKVEPTLQVQGHPGHFAIGDIIDWKEQKQAAKAPSHAAVAAANVASFLNGTPQKSVYKGSVEMIVLPIGKYGGAGYMAVLWGITIGSWLTRFLKGKELLVPAARKRMGYRP